MNLEEKEADAVIHVCGTVEPGKYQAQHVTDASTICRCDKCGVRVWVSTASSAAVHAEAKKHSMPVRVLCIGCGSPYIPRSRVMPPTLEQMLEILAELEK